MYGVVSKLNQKIARKESHPPASNTSAFMFGNSLPGLRHARAKVKEYPENRKLEPSRFRSIFSLLTFIVPVSLLLSLLVIGR